ncbi:uroporphyrinogen-III synthase [Caulobacter rhizosphaerae]|jgi:uroporphyrinogen-III synthase|uniref:uroporphyrinogen-III synthase n=1 Tax=Caulobacter rhizosphaerae TaxID=2010972 RepID=UPI0013D2BBC6|nr:uroporphyrinogen-III synthase [Caulobacter rhizosphaerae]GGL17822.1 uroporphyrinogen III methyltransferase [Caulobacter rhizosphaerae]
MTVGARRIWVTRALPGAEGTAARLEAMGLAPLIDPLLEVRDLSPPVDLAGVAALAFTSVNGVAAFARLDAGRDRPVFAVGDRTARAAREAGFSSVTSAAGDVEALTALILDHAGRLDGAVLHPSALEPAGDLVTPLVSTGLNARRLAVYEAVERDPSSSTLSGLDQLEAVLLHSPRAARALSCCLAERPAPALRALCLSAAVARPLEGLLQAGGLGGVTSAPHPDETALLALLTL